MPPMWRTGGKTSSPLDLRCKKHTPPPRNTPPPGCVAQQGIARQIVVERVEMWRDRYPGGRASKRPAVRREKRLPPTGLPDGQPTPPNSTTINFVALCRRAANRAVSGSSGRPAHHHPTAARE